MRYLFALAVAAGVGWALYRYGAPSEVVYVVRSLVRHLLT